VTVLDFIYTMLTLTMGISALVNGAIGPGIAGIVGPTLCCFAASALKGSLTTGTSQEKAAGLGAAITFVAVGIGLVYHSGYSVGLLGYNVPGVTWCLVGLAAGWLATFDPRSKKPAAGTQ
jgi:hypothetical protein